MTDASVGGGEYVTLTDEPNRRNEDVLRKSEERYRTLFGMMGEGFCIIERIEASLGGQLDFRYLTANPAFERHTDMRDVIGKTIRELVPNANEAVIDLYDEVVRTGERRHFEAYISALDLWMEAEVFPIEVPGRVAVLFSNIGARKRAEEALRESERRMRTLAIGIPQLVFRCEGDGSRTWGSPQWIAFTGLTFEESVGFGWLNAVHPDDREATMRAWGGVAERGRYYCEHRILGAATGEYRWHQTRATPLRDEQEKILEWLGTSTDVEELRRLQRHQQLLIGELQHRVRNTLGVVRSIVRRTAERSCDVMEMAAHLQGRLAAFSRVQAAVTRTPEGGVDLAGLIEDELVAHAARESERVTVAGPDIALKAWPAGSLSLAIHELASNAVRYGALGAGEGRLSIRWSREERDGQHRLRLEWIERGLDRPLETPEHRGFGLELLERSLPYELGAVTDVEFAPEGFRFTMEMPLDQHIRGGEV